MLLSRRLCGTVLCWVALLQPLVVSAETVYLRDGRVVSGRLVGQTRTEIRVQTGGRLEVISKTKIRRITYEDESVSNRAAEARRKAVAARKADEERKAAAARKADEERKTAAARKADEERKAAAARKADEERKAAAARKADEERKAAAARTADEERKAAAARKVGPKEPRANGSQLPARSLWSAPLWSAVLPGWGHQTLDRPVIGWAYTGAFVGAVALAGALRADATAARSKYDTATTRSKLWPILSSSGALLTIVLDARARNRYEESVAEYRQSLGLVAFVYVFQLAHAFWSGWSAGMPTPPAAARDSGLGSSFVISGNPVNGRMEVGFRFRL